MDNHSSLCFSTQSVSGVLTKQPKQCCIEKNCIHTQTLTNNHETRVVMYSTIKHGT